MKKIYYLGTAKRKNEEIDKIYMNLKTNQIICLKQDETERIITLHEKQNLRRIFKKKINYLRNKRRLYYTIMAFITSGILFYFEKQFEKNKPVLLNNPELYLKALLEEELDNQILIDMCLEYIDRNENYTPEQKRELKETWKMILSDYGEKYQIHTFINLLNSLANNDVKYPTNKEDNIVLGYTENNEIIKINSEKKNVMSHESIHNALRNSLEHIAVEEGYDSAIIAKYYEDISYFHENEDLLLISEIVGKDTLLYCIINGKENLLYEFIMDKTNIDKKELKRLFNKMDEALELDRQARNKKEEMKTNPVNKNFLMNEIEQLCFQAECLHKEIRIKWALLAIQKDSQNEKSFIIQNALSSDHCILYSSFLKEEYIFWNEKEQKIIIINENNKYENKSTLEEQMLHQ